LHEGIALAFSTGGSNRRSIELQRPVHRRFLVRVVIATAIAIATPVIAHAQMYAWRDAAGNLVLSDRAKDPSAKTYAIADASSVAGFRTTRRVSPLAAQYQSLIEEHAALNTVSPDLVRAVIQAESAFNPRALSPKGAMGLMQLMPATAVEFGVIDPYDPVENIRAGVKYLKHLLDTYAGRVELALAAYNAGPGAVKKYGGTVPPYRETKNYVAKVQGDAASTAPRTRVYKTVEIVDGREVVRYTGTPRDGSARVTSAERR
jgi:soluble lytic murein transglycosylase-like protein